MDNKEDRLLTISQFSKLSGISRANLIFYDKENLLKPVLRKTNKYRFYEYNQISKAYKIVIFRKMGFSITEIYNYFMNFSKNLMLDMISNNIKNLESQIENLEQQKYNLSLYKRYIEKYESRNNEGIFEEEFFDSEELFLNPLSKKEKINKMNDFLIYCRKNNINIDYHIGRVFFKNLSSERDWHITECIFFKKIKGNYKKEAGKYLVYTNFSDGMNLNKLYKEVFQYIESKDYKINGSIYEDYPLSGIFATDENRHLIRISVAIKNYP
ncbi:MerR family transcriptional regulator [Fusobacterium simiae]|uniref:MerR family transcriptional regulator n=1 Tax=Fusobacterium simiae TaxID=855 RepID=A0ABT4DIC3_FUSSI|nr:MerR family transcriptional regulator [Fusobacterium simiae]MCY7008355.1 MerR family transcriptional regulator [Fusobacterium simiae]